MLTLPFSGLARGEVKLVELVSMPGNPGHCKGRNAEKLRLSGLENCLFCVCPTNNKGRQHRAKKG